MKNIANQKWIVVGVLALSAFGCGKPVDSAKAAALVPAASVPGGSVSGGNVDSVNSALKGTYKFNESACYEPNGTFDTQASWSEQTLAISSSSWIKTIDEGDGCVVTETYDILGFTSSKVTLGNQRVGITYYGQADTNGDCSQYQQPPATGQTWTYGWIAPSAGQFAVLSAPTGNCQSNEYDADLFDKQS